MRSRHPSVEGIRQFVKLPVPAVYRHGSTTESELKYEINSIESVKNSASKFRMKKCFLRGNVKSAEFYFAGDNCLNQVTGVDEENNFILQAVPYENIQFPLVAKIDRGSRGSGMVKIDNAEHLRTFIQNRIRPNTNYYFERFYNYSREYRLHVDAQGYFYACRKVLKNETPQDQRWYRNDSNCNWIIEENELFSKPKSWDTIVEHCVRALNSVGLDIGACDVKVQTDKNNKGKVRENQDFIVIEINSAPSFGDITEEKYKERLPETLKHKYKL